MLTRRLILAGTLGTLAIALDQRLAVAGPTAAPLAVASSPYPGTDMYPTNVLYPEG